MAIPALVIIYNPVVDDGCQDNCADAQPHVKILHAGLVILLAKRIPDNPVHYITDQANHDKGKAIAYT